MYFIRENSKLLNKEFVLQTNEECISVPRELKEAARTAHSAAL